MSGKSSSKGFLMIVAIIAVVIISISLLTATKQWSMIKQRDNEHELIFRGKEYAYGIKLFKSKFRRNPKNLKELWEKKCIRKIYKDPMSQNGKWYLIFLNNKNKMIAVPQDLSKNYLKNSQLKGVCSSSKEEGYKKYKEKSVYREWLFIEAEKKDMNKGKTKQYNIIYIGDNEKK